jgi:hypothetical protein
LEVWVVEFLGNLILSESWWAHLTPKSGNTGPSQHANAGRIRV